MVYTGVSPRKVVPLSSGDETRAPATASPSTTTRSFFCSVVVESSSSGELSKDVRALVASLGDRVTGIDETGSLHGADAPLLAIPNISSSPSKDGFRAKQSALADVVNELVSTERSYVQRLHILKESYADPLRTFARAKESAILPAYEAKTLFGNIDAILHVNQAFLHDLELMMRPDGPRIVGGIGDVALKHFKDLRAFDCYKQYYSKREEAQTILKREKSKKSSTGFATFVDHVKDSTSDLRNRVGLSELLMDPVQRIPRYTLLWELMIKYMPPGDPQRAKLVEACGIAQKIAKAEIDDPTKRAAIWHCLERSVEDFPPNLISNGRRFIACIDVEDIPVDVLPSGASMSSSSSFSSSGALHCTLFLFDDKLMIVKRPNASASGKTLTGLDQLDKSTKSGGLPLGIKKNGMIYKGVVDITDVVATDVGHNEMHIYLEVTPPDQTDRWSGRPFRTLSVVNPSAPPNVGPMQTQNEKRQFLEHLWTMQALYRARHGRSIALCLAEREVESYPGRTTLARTYFNIYQRTAYLGEPRKGKVVLHVDPSGAADGIPFGIDGPPYVVIRVQPLAGELCRYSVTSNDPNGEEEVDIVHTPTVTDRIVQTVHQFGLFKFRTGKNSAPSTPSASTRSKVAMFGLDAISRNFFPGKGGDVFGTALNNNLPRRSRSAASHTSTQTVTTMDSGIRFSTRSTSTAATSVLMDEMPSQVSPPRKLQRGRKSYSEKNGTPRSRSHSRTRDEDESTIQAHEPRGQREIDESELDLNTRLALARRNSRNQETKGPPLLTNPPVEDTIYEEEPPAPAANMSKVPSRPTTPIRPGPATPTKDIVDSSGKERRRSVDRRPMGPRPPSPLPPRSPDFEAVESTLENLVHTPVVSPQKQTVKSAGNVSHIPRLPLEPRVNDAVPGADLPTASSSSVEPLSIKKKISVRSGGGASSPSKTRSTHVPSRAGSTRRTSPHVNGVKRTTSLNDQGRQDLSTQVLVTAQSTREDVDSVRRVVKRIKLEVTTLKTSSHEDVNEDSENEPSVPRNIMPRSAHTRHMSAKSEADARIEEMRQMIALRQAESPSRRQARDDTTPLKRVTNYQDQDHRLQGSIATIENLTSQSERELKRAAANQELLHADLKVLTSEFKEKSAEVLTTRAELQNTKRQLELVKNLLADATAENDILHQAFNEELDGMYNDANLPETEAWLAMTKDLRECKDTRNALRRENISLKRKLDEVDSQNAEWGAILRAHGLIA